MANSITRRIYGASSASTNSLAFIDIVADSVLVGVEFGIQNIGPVSTDQLDLELSSASVYQGQTNDALGIIGHATWGFILTTSGAANTAVCITVTPLNYFIPRGTRLYIHTSQTGTTIARCRATLHLLTK